MTFVLGGAVTLWMGGTRSVLAHDAVLVIPVSVTLSN